MCDSPPGATCTIYDKHPEGGAFVSPSFPPPPAPAAGPGTPWSGWVYGVLFLMDGFSRPDRAFVISTNVYNVGPACHSPLFVTWRVLLMTRLTRGNMSSLRDKALAKKIAPQTLHCPPPYVGAMSSDDKIKTPRVCKQVLHSPYTQSMAGTISPLTGHG